MKVASQASTQAEGQAMNFLSFKDHLNTCLEKSRLILNSHQYLAKTEHVPHSYDDKYKFAEYLTKVAAQSLINSLSILGIDKTVLLQLKTWSSSHEVVLRMSFENKCVFTHEHGYKVKNASEVQTSFSTLLFGSSTYSKVTDYFYEFSSHNQLTLMSGHGANELERINIMGPTTKKKLRLSYHNAPYPENSSNRWDLNLTWLLVHLSDNCEEIAFEIDRLHPKCFNPLQNNDIKKSVEFFNNCKQWAISCYSYHKNLTAVEATYPENDKSPDFNVIKGFPIFSPVVPLFNDRKNVENRMICELQPEVVAVEDGEYEQRRESSTVVISEHTMHALLAEEQRTVKEARSKIAALYVADTSNSSNVSVTSPPALVASRLPEESLMALIILEHIGNTTHQYVQAMYFIEEMIMNQLVAAIGKIVSPLDFVHYMKYHARHMFKEEFQPTGFSYTVRRSSEHSAEGMLSIEEKHGRIGDASLISTFSRLCYNDNNNMMSFAINSSTNIRFSGDKIVHGWLNHSFKCAYGKPAISLVAQARQFSSFIVLLGRITSPTSFEPEHAMIVQNLDELRIPLNLEIIPTAGEFKKAIDSMSSQQQKFAQSFRSMQLESTLFGVCVIQIKPQLEKVLNLAPDSLTKEIQLTQDLMEMFIKYQIPSDLLACRNVASSTVTEVQSHVDAIKTTIQQQKKQQLQEKAMTTIVTNKPCESRKLLESTKSTVQSALLLASLRAVQESEQIGRCTLEELRKQGAAIDDINCEIGCAAQGLQQRAGVFGKKSSLRPKRASLFSGAFFGKSSSPSSSSTPANREAFISRLKLESASAGQERFRGGGGGRGAAQPTSSPAAVVAQASTRTMSCDNKRQAVAPVDVAGGDATVTVAGASDFTHVPSTLERKFESCNVSNAVRPTIIRVSNVAWSCQTQAALLAAPVKSMLAVEQQQLKRNIAYDLLCALTRSGSLPLEQATLHVIVGATHCFVQNVMDTVVKENINPIEPVERSMLIMAAAVLDQPAESLLQDDQLYRLQDCLDLLSN